MSRILNFRSLCFAVAALSASVAFAAPSGKRLFINGVDVTGMTNQNYEKVNIKIDASGDVYVEAPQYVVKKITKDEGTAPASPLTHTYFLVTEANVAGMTEYQVDVSINGKVVRTVKASEPPVAMDINKYLLPGTNAVKMSARKVYDKPGSPKSTSRAMTFKVIIGEGTQTANATSVDKQLITFVRDASQTDNAVQEYTFDAS